MTENGIIINEGVELNRNKIYQIKIATKLIKENGFLSQDFKNSIPKWIERIKGWKDVNRLIVNDFISINDLIELSKQCKLGLLSSLLIIRRYIDIEFYGQELIDKWVDELTHLDMAQKKYKNLYKSMNEAGMLSEEFREKEKGILKEFHENMNEEMPHENEFLQKFRKRVQLLENKNREMQKLLEQAFGQIAILDLKLKEMNNNC